MFTSLAVNVPFTDQAEPSEVISNGLIATENNNGTSTVTAIREKNSVQVNTVIQGTDSPKEFPYQFELPAGAQAYLAGESVFFMQGEHSLGGIAPAWAKDALGRGVPTWYELRGDGLVVQVVEHSDQYAYPIVTDPWIGMWLFEGFSSSRKTYAGQKVYSARLTAWAGLFTPALQVVEVYFPLQRGTKLFARLDGPNGSNG